MDIYELVGHAMPDAHPSCVVALLTRDARLAVALLGPTCERCSGIAHYLVVGASSVFRWGRLCTCRSDGAADCLVHGDPSGDDDAR